MLKIKPMMQITYDDDMKDILGRSLHVVAPSCNFSCCISASRPPSIEQVNDGNLREYFNFSNVRGPGRVWEVGLAV